MNELQKLVINAVAALDKLVVYRDDHPEMADLPDVVQAAFCEAESADHALSQILEKLQ